MNTNRRRDSILLVIGVLKLFKAALLLIVAVGAIKLLHRDVAAVLVKWSSAVRVDPDSHFVELIIQKLGFLNDRVLAEIGAASLFYAALLAIEGLGLCFRKRWAEYMTTIITISLLPMEAYTLLRQFSVAKLFVTLLNVAIVWYLIRRLRQDA
jgi:uncharacterized membrane protein (DUF2068 family)